MKRLVTTSRDTCFGRNNFFLLLVFFECVFGSPLTKLLYNDLCSLCSCDDPYVQSGPSRLVILYAFLFVIFIRQLKTEYATMKEDLCLIYENKVKVSIIRSKIRWIEQGEKPTKHFFNLKKRNYTRKVIKPLKRPDGELITDELKILKEIESYYRNLYSSVIDRGIDLFEEFIGNLEIPKLEDTARDELEGEIALKECQDILCTFKRKNLQEVMDLRGNSITASLICSDMIL